MQSLQTDSCRRFPVSGALSISRLYKFDARIWRSRATPKDGDLANWIALEVLAWLLINCSFSSVLANFFWKEAKLQETAFLSISLHLVDTSQERIFSCLKRASSKRVGQILSLGPAFGYYRPGVTRVGCSRPVTSIFVTCGPKVHISVPELRSCHQNG